MNMRPCFALIVGVDQYDTRGPMPLRGCVNDSQDMIDYLKVTFRIGDHVVGKYIKHLTNKDATREAIISAFETHLIENRNIQEDDPIIFYFAGHGGRQPTDRRGWVPQHGKAEVICPYNVGSAHGIPDYTMAALLRRLQHFKGKNITVILDSCHSGGMDRDPDVDSGIRSYNPRTPLPADLDARILSWAPSGSFGDSHPLQINGMNSAMRSSVLLAACAPEKIARETTSSRGTRGLFTEALIRKMSEYPNETYWRLIEEVNRLPHVQPQGPCCVGVHQHRRLFGIQSDNRFIIYKEGIRYYVDAGWIHGVHIDTTTFTSRFPSTPPLSLYAVEGDRSLLRPSPHLSDAIVGEKVTINDRRRETDIFNFYLHHRPREEHDLGDRADSYSSRQPTKPIVELVIKSLSVDRTYNIYKPDSRSDVLFTAPSDSHPPRIGDAEVRSLIPYGLQLINNAPIPLYVYMFYFEPSTYSIELWYSSDSPLQPKSDGKEDHVLKVLAEDGGWLGKRFITQNGKRKDIDFVKIYASNERVNMTHIPCLLSGAKRVSSQTVKPNGGHAWTSLLYKITTSNV